MPIIPDSKDWTWVIQKPCPECGFDAAMLSDGTIPAAIIEATREWPHTLAGTSIRERPDDSTWSELEYAAHVRDVLRLYRERLAIMVEFDDPLYANWDQDATAVEERYNEQDPARVASQLVDAAAALAADFATVQPAAWNRTGRRSDGASFTVSSISRYLVHDLVHHRWDVTAARSSLAT